MSKTFRWLVRILACSAIITNGYLAYTATNTGMFFLNLAVMAIFLCAWPILEMGWAAIDRANETLPDAGELGVLVRELEGHVNRGRIDDAVALARHLQAMGVAMNLTLIRQAAMLQADLEVTEENALEWLREENI